MQFETIQSNVLCGVGTLTLNRPKAMNALNQQMMLEVGELISHWENEPSVRVIILTGSEKAFAAGADISEMVDIDYLDALEQNFLNDWTCIANCRKPIIAAVAGYALGGGCELAMMCDFILAADTAQFGQPEIRIGTLPGLGGTQRLTGLIGKSKAMELCLTGRLMGAEEAERAGLVARIVSADELLTDAQKTAEQIAGFSSPAVQLAREAVQASLETNLQQGLQVERRSFYSLFGSHDQKEGMSAFLGKRDAEFER
ncbi:enoyl-CoA hydratase-related protein [Granulosicoccus sp.]|nr:enoyl-CoA hydratase-related protein [Granulosicoccus sp.]MDB4222696.1 enoyl-CoA hydratase-related protein [Granulosicoccus sp.]